MLKKDRILFLKTVLGPVFVILISITPGFFRNYGLMYSINGILDEEIFPLIFLLMSPFLFYYLPKLIKRFIEEGIGLFSLQDPEQNK